MYDLYDVGKTLDIVDLSVTGPELMLLHYISL